MKRHDRLAVAVMASAWLLMPAAQAQDLFGTIKGKVTFEGEPPAPKVLVEQGDDNIANQHGASCVKAPIYSREFIVDADTKGIAHCWVYLVKPNGTNPAKLDEIEAKAPEVVIDQVNCEFVPYCTAISVKQQTLVIKSSDPLNHNTRYHPDKNPPGCRSLPAAGQFKETFRHAERSPTQLKCDIHPWMSGWFFLFDHPFHAVTDKGGNFEITGVPAGTQNLVVRFPNGKVINAGKLKGDPVEVKAGETLEVNFSTKTTPFPEIGKADPGVDRIK